MVVALVVLFFGIVFLGGGYAIYSAGGASSATAKALETAGQLGIVHAARVNIGRGQDGETTALKIELSFTGHDGQNHTLATDHFPRFAPDINAPLGWTADFPNKADIVGQAVTYRLGDAPAVELNSELEKLAGSGIGFAGYLGLTLMALGALILIVSVVLLIRLGRGK